ncbi:STAS domain-containing protein [Yinghuangia soli]|uniref:Anti-sigma factor antagonist n=1 Tax=Yinghuangia soli TaxID=2908204 RepID=A0AA41Q8K9_9ACTN|nr:STAS domain-containing protein [Yinghuangia soli]MCF2533438.1 STAS domain-containing protein [Yinghuangia soli]
MTAPKDPGGTPGDAVDADWTVVAADGDIDFYSAEEFGAKLDAVAGDGARHIVVDMSTAGFLDSSGLRVLLHTARELRESGGMLRLAAAPEQTLRVIDLAQVGPLLPTFEDVATAAGS